MPGHKVHDAVALVFIAGVIVTTLTLMGWWGAAVAGIGLALLAVLAVWRS